MNLSELLIQTPDGKTRTVPLTSDRIALGRSSANELCYPDDSGLSRQHLVFERSGTFWIVRDLDSKNGTQVNSIRIKGWHVLQPGDRVTAGHLTIQQRTQEQAPPSQTVSSCRRRHHRYRRPPSKRAWKGFLAIPRARTEELAGLTGMNSVQALIRAGQELSSYRPLSELFPLILDLSISTVGATRGVSDAPRERRTGGSSGPW